MRASSVNFTQSSLASPQLVKYSRSTKISIHRDTIERGAPTLLIKLFLDTQSFCSVAM